MPAVKLYEFETPSYTLVMESANQAPLLLEKVSALERLLPTLVDHDDSGETLPTCIFVFPALHWRNYLDYEASDYGFLPQRFSNLILIDSSNRAGALRWSVFREFPFAYLRARYPRRYPYWFELGLSRVMAGAILNNGKAYLGVEPYFGGDVLLMNSGTFVVPNGIGPKFRFPISRLLQLDALSLEDSDESTAMTARRQSWALVHRGLVTEPAFGARFDAYIAAREKLLSVDDALQEAFGTNSAELDAQMAQFEKRHVVGSRTVPLPPPIRSSKLTPYRLLFEGDALVKLARALLDGGVDAQKLAPLIGGAAQLSGDTAGVRALRMRLAVRGHDDTAFVSLFSKVDDKFLPPGFGREAALALVERLYGALPSVNAASAIDLQGLRERAFTLLGPVVAANPADVEAAWGHALLAADLKRDLPRAQAAISAARERLPRSPDLALAAARVDEALGDQKAALKDLVTVFRFSRNAELRVWAAKRIDEFATPTP